METEASPDFNKKQLPFLPNLPASVQLGEEAGGIQVSGDELNGDHLNGDQLNGDIDPFLPVNSRMLFFKGRVELGQPIIVMS